MISVKMMLPCTAQVPTTKRRREEAVSTRMTRSKMVAGSTRITRSKVVARSTRSTKKTL